MPRHSPFFAALRSDPVLAYVKMIAEPWDIGPGGYQLGHFPAGWSEWNDRYRDTMRAFWRGDRGLVGAFAERFAGSSDLFRQHGRMPTAGVNFVTSLDGFTLADLVSYNERRNEADLENGADGHTHNLSWNCGAEGPTDDAGVNALGARQVRNFLATLFLSAGRADAARGRRDRPLAGRRQQRLLPGQRDHLARLEQTRAQRRPAALRQE